MLSMKHFPTNYNTQLKPPTLFNMYLKHYIVCMKNCIKKLTIESVLGQTVSHNLIYKKMQKE